MLFLPTVGFNEVSSPLFLPVVLVTLDLEVSTVVPTGSATFLASPSALDNTGVSTPTPSSPCSALLVPSFLCTSCPPIPVAIKACCSSGVNSKPGNVACCGTFLLVISILASLESYWSKFSWSVLADSWSLFMFFLRFVSSELSVQPFCFCFVSSSVKFLPSIVSESFIS